MEKDGFFNNSQAWKSIFGMELEMAIESQVSELNCSSEQLSNCFLNRNWDHSMDQSDPFESALSSIVSSPVNSHAGIPNPAGENVVLRELIGRLGSICNSGEISPQSCIGGNNSTNTSCYNTPLNSPPKLNLSMDHHHRILGNVPIPIPRNHQLPPTTFADLGFVERAARFSCFGMNESEFPNIVESESRNLSRMSRKQSVTEFPTTIPSSDKKFSRELDSPIAESSLTEPIPNTENGIKGQNTNSNGRKRKSAPKGKGKETQFNKTIRNGIEPEKEESDAKRSKSGEEGNGMEKEKEKEEGNQNQNQNKKRKQIKEDAKVEPPKDYIHVRARRGEATDSHSLAERVRREKISERMKFLQDLVPGCNKVTGKAVMLDEIINYVQSLQRQVEFLSMKLATMNPRTDMNLEALLSKDTRASMLNNVNHLDAPAQPFYGLVHDRPQNPLTSMMHHGSNMKSSQTDAFGEASSFWENDLQSVVKMGFIQNQEPIFHGIIGSGQMKVEQ